MPQADTKKKTLTKGKSWEKHNNVGRNENINDEGEKFQDPKDSGKDFELDAINIKKPTKWKGELTFEPRHYSSR